jgi:hypothetical protein
MKNRLTIACFTLLVVIAASPVSAQNPVYHANVLEISDGRTNIQVEVPKGMNRWGHVCAMTRRSRERRNQVSRS